MSSKRPALSNLVVCSVFKLRQDYPAVFEALGKDSAEGDKVSSYDVLSCLTGRDFEDCFNAVQKAEGTGLVDLGSDVGDGWLTVQGQEFMDTIPLDVLDMSRNASNSLSYAARDAVMEAIDAVPAIQPARPTRIAAGAIDLDIDTDGPSLDDDDIGILDDDGTDDVPSIRRPSARA